MINALSTLNCNCKEQHYELDDLLQEQAVTFEEHLSILPAIGRRRKIKLMRTSYTLKLIKTFETKVDGTTIYLPALSASESTFVLKLVTIKKPNRKSGYAFYLRSLGPNLQKVNGVYCSHCYLQKGDEALIGHNRLIFSSFESIDDEIDDLYCSQALVESNINILLEGETGTGKTTLAKEIHNRSKRKGNFVHINLSSFSPSLIESELFGHIKGAFTGAESDKMGAICEADRGTLFIDEIDSLPKSIQTKLLLFLDSKEVRPVGGGGLKKVDVRLIFASGKSSEYLLKGGIMREDFFYRLTSGLTLFLPPLRERPDKIQKICNEFSEDNSIYIVPNLIEYYKTLPWPGNIRQLKGHLLKKKLLSRSRRIELSAVDETLLSSQCELEKMPKENFLSLQQVKENYCIRVFMALGQNVKDTCQILKITSGTLRRITIKKKLGRKN